MFQLLEILKCVSLVFARHSVAVADVVTHVLQHLAFMISTLIDKAKVKKDSSSCQSDL